MTGLSPSPGMSASRQIGQLELEALSEAVIMRAIFLAMDLVTICLSIVKVCVLQERLLQSADRVGFEPNTSAQGQLDVS